MTTDTLDGWLAEASIPELAATLARVSARLLEFQGNAPPGAPLDGEGLKALRMDLSFTQEQAAKILGVTLRTVWRWEHGITALDPLRGGAARQRLYEAARSREARRHPLRALSGGVGARPGAAPFVLLAAPRRC